MTDPYIPGIRRVRVREDGRRAGTDEDYYFAINLDQLTREVAFREPGYEQDKGTPQEFWSDMELAQALLGDLDATFVKKEQAEELALQLSEVIAGVPMNDKAVAYGRPAEGGGFSSRLDDGTTPTVLYIPERETRNTKLRMNYRRLAAARTYEVTIGDQEKIFERLTYLTKIYLEPLQKNNAELQAASAVVIGALGKVENAHLAVTAMMDFAQPAIVRRGLWTAIDENDIAYELFEKDQIIPKLPTKTQREAAKSLRDNALPSLAKWLAKLLAWINSGVPSDGKPYAPAAERNELAKRYLDMLRDDEVVLELLENNEFVEPFVWRLFENFLVESFQQLATAPDVLADLTKSEFMTLARVATARDLVLKVPAESTHAQRALIDRVSTFVPETELRDNKTALGEALEKLDAVASLKSSITRHGDTLARLVFGAMPSVTHHLAEIANAMNENGELTARAWVFRTVVGVANINDHRSQQLFEQVSELARLATDEDKAKKAKAMAGLVFDPKSGALRESKAWLANELAWKGLASAVAFYAVWEAWLPQGSHKDKDAAQRSLQGLTLICGAAQSGVELVQTLAKGATFTRAAGEHGASLLGSLEKVTGHGLYKGLGHFSSFLGFVSAIMSAANTRPKSATEADIAREKVLLQGLQFVLSVAGEVVPGGLPLAGLVLFAGQTFLLNRELWAEVIADIEALPGPGRYVRQVWSDIKYDKTLQRYAKASPYGGFIDTQLQQIELYTPEAAESGWAATWRIAPGDMTQSPLVAGVLVRQYGFDPASAGVIASR